MSSTDPHTEAAVWIAKGNSLRDLGHLEEALAAYERAIVLDPKNPDAWDHKGNALDNLGRFQEALSACKRVVELDPHDGVGWLNMSKVLQELGHFEDALKACTHVIDLNPNYGPAWLTAGNVLNALGRYREALPAYERATALLPDEAYCWNGAGNALTALGRYEEALATFERAIDLAPDFAGTWIGKGNVYLRHGRIEEACQAYRRFIFLANGSEVAFVAGNLLWAFEKESQSPFLLFRLVQEYPHLLVQDSWLQAVRSMEKAYGTPLACMFALENLPAAQAPEERRLRLRVGGCLTFHMGDPMAAESGFFDVLNDEFPDDLLGQYYLASSRNAYLADNSLTLAEAVAAARRTAGSEPEQWYYAACILALAGEDGDAFKALERAGAYTPALLLRFSLAWATNEDALVRALAEQLLDLEGAALPQRRLLRFNTDIEFDLTSSEWMEGILHWAKQTELAGELDTFLGYLDSADCYDLRLKHGEALLETQAGALDLAVAWRLDDKSRRMMEGLADGARRANLDEMRLQLSRVGIDVQIFAGLQGLDLERSLEVFFRNGSLELEAEILLVAYFYSRTSLSLREAFSLLVYRQYRHGVKGGGRLKDWHVDALLSLAGGVGATVSQLPAWLSGGSTASTLSALLVPASLTWVASRIIRSLTSAVVDYDTFKAEMAQEARTKGWELPEGFWDQAE